MKQALILFCCAICFASFDSHPNELPKNCIILWGAKTAIPHGWAICDGLNGTPDLKNKYVEGTNELVKVGTIDENGAETHTPTGRTGRYIGPDAFDVNPHEHFPGNQAVRTVNNAFELNINPLNTLPPSVRLIYIMKL